MVTNLTTTMKKEDLVDGFHLVWDTAKQESTIILANQKDNQVTYMGNSTIDTIERFIERAKNPDVSKRDFRLVCKIILPEVNASMFVEPNL